MLAATGNAGYAASRDGGRTWDTTAAGMHGSYARAIALANGHVLVSSSTGPRSNDGAVYRRAIDDQAAFEPIGAGLPGRFDGNVDTATIAGAGDEAAVVGPDGAAYRSHDAGATWEQVGSDLLRPRWALLVA